MSKSLEEMEALIPPKVKINPLFPPYVEPKVEEEKCEHGVVDCKTSHGPEEAEKVVESWSERIISWFTS